MATIEEKVKLAARGRAANRAIIKDIQKLLEKGKLIGDYCGISDLDVEVGTIPSQSSGNRTVKVLLEIVQEAILLRYAKAEEDAIIAEIASSLPDPEATE